MPSFHGFLKVYRSLPAEKLSEVHELWLARADNVDPEVADEVFLRCSVYQECQAIWDALLTKLERRRVAPSSTGLLLRAMLADLSDKAKRARVVKLATRIVEDESQDEAVRSMTLAALWNAKLPEARVLAEKYRSSPPGLLQLQAKEILEAKEAAAGAEAAAR